MSKDFDGKSSDAEFGLTAALSNVGLDLETQRLPQDFHLAVAVRKVLDMIPVRKPHKQEFVRTRPGPEWRIQVLVIRIKNPDEYYLVAPEFWNELSQELVPVELVLAISTTGNVMLVPIPIASDEGRRNLWASSLASAMARAQTNPVRLRANTDQGFYDYLEALEAHPEPEWPTLSMREIVLLAFKDKFIKTLDHPIVKLLQGRR